MPTAMARTCSPLDFLPRGAWRDPHLGTPCRSVLCSSLTVRRRRPEFPRRCQTDGENQEGRAKRAASTSHGCSAARAPDSLPLA